MARNGDIVGDDAERVAVPPRSRNSCRMQALAGAAIAAVAIPGAASAQPVPQSEPAPPSASPRRSFTPADFARFAPRTALDMAQEIPGFTIREPDGSLRGFGQADSNVLINGRRIFGDGNGPRDALSRVPAGDVVRLDLVDGASLEIGGLSGQVLNVITRSSGQIAGQFRYSPQFRSEGTPFRWGDARLSLSGGGGGTEWTLSLENDQERRGDAGPELVFDGNGGLIDLREERNNENSDRFSLSGSLTRTAANGNVLNLTGLTEGFIFRGTEVSERSFAGQPDRVRSFRRTEDEFNYELGANYSFALLGGRLKLIGYRRYENSPTLAAALTEFSDGRPDTGSVFTQQANEAETILRSEFTFRGLGGDWQASLEGARNILDIEAQFEERDAGGVLRPVVLPGATARVEEDRAEATLTYSRPLSPRLRLQASLGGEYSQIVQSGELGLTRGFVRPKGFLSLDWQANPRLNLSTKLERAVGQLSFFDFIASVNVNQGQVNVTNANLVPPQSWQLTVEGAQNLGALGSVTLRGFIERITDIVDQIPIAGGGQAPGNIASATRYGLSGNLTLLSEPLGWRGARLNVTASYTDSSVIDPLLGTSRRISDRDYFDLEARLRQDVPGSDWALGVNLFYEEDTPAFRLDEIAIFSQSFAFAALYVEHKDVFGLTIRGTIGNLLNRTNNFDRTVFADRLNGLVAFRETRARSFGTIFSLDIEGSF